MSCKSAIPTIVALVLELFKQMGPLVSHAFQKLIGDNILIKY